MSGMLLHTVKCNGISLGKVLSNRKMLLRDFIHITSPTIKEEINNNSNNYHHTCAFCIVISFSSNPSRPHKQQSHEKYIWLWEIQNPLTCLGAVLWLLAPWCGNECYSIQCRTFRKAKGCMHSNPRCVRLQKPRVAADFTTAAQLLRPEAVLCAAPATRRTVLPCPGVSVFTNSRSPESLRLCDKSAHRRCRDGQRQNRL